MTHKEYDNLEWVVIKPIEPIETIAYDTGEVDEFGEPIYELLDKNKTQEPFVYTPIKE